MRLLLPVTLAVLFSPTSLLADDIRWRPSYAEAYEESQKTGKPMLMEFGSEGCYWCKKLDAATLTLPDVAKLVNEKFIPVRLDAQAEVELCRAVNVHSLPTMFVLAPDRTILNRYEGYAEGPTVIQFLQAGLDRAPAPAKK